MAVQAEDPDGRTVPYCLSGGTDAKAFSQLGVRGFGFSPLRLPPELDFTGMFHGIDERVPVESLQFGARVLDRLFAPLLTALRRRDQRDQSVRIARMIRRRRTAVRVPSGKSRSRASSQFPYSACSAS